MDNLKSYVVKGKIQNRDLDGKKDDRFETEDRVYIPSYADVLELKENGYDLSTGFTDYAIVNWEESLRHSTKNNRFGYYLRGTISKYPHELMCVYNERDALLFEEPDSAFNSHGIRPMMKVDSFKIAKDIKNGVKWNFGTGKDAKGKFYHTIEFGEYPQSTVSNDLNQKLESLYNIKRLQETGKIYRGKDCKEYIYEGKKYVRVESLCYVSQANKVRLANGATSLSRGSVVWVEVEPIRWIITNYEDMPKEINPASTKTGYYPLKLWAEKTLESGMIYNNNDLPYKWEVNPNRLWQNSYIRAFLNGYDIEEELKKGNGLLEYKSLRTISFKDKPYNFMETAFVPSNVQEKTYDDLAKDVSENVKVEVEKKKVEQVSSDALFSSRLASINPDKSSEVRTMTDTEIIKSWIDAGQSVLLRGPSGIGKTERIRTLYPDLVYLKLTNNMFPEKVVGAMNLQTGQAIPPDFAKTAIMNCATESERKLIEQNVQNLFKLADDIYERSKDSEKKTVILLDELLNVKPPVQGLVYTLVLNKFVETGKGLKLPANTVVVATGNPKKYSILAQDLAEPLEKRFDHIYDMEPRVGDWLFEYAIPNKLHPAVVGYIFTNYQERKRSEKLEDMDYFYEEPFVAETNIDKNGCKARTNDPRGWTSISNMLYAFESDLQEGKFIGKDVEDLLQVSLYSKLRDNWAEDFYNFYCNPILSPEDVITGNYTSEDLPQTSNERFACMSALLCADESQVAKCREFVNRYCAPEYLAVYDMYWANISEKRKQIIEDIKHPKETTFKKEIKAEKSDVKTRTGGGVFDRIFNGR